MRTPAYPPSTIVLQLDTEDGRRDVSVSRRPDGRLVVVDPRLDTLSSLFGELELPSVDRLVLVTRSVGRGERDQTVASVAAVDLDIDPQWTVLRSSPTPPARVSTSSLSASLQTYREFLASWTEGEYLDLTLRMDGAWHTTRMVRDGEGSVQAVVPTPVPDLALFLMDLQDVEITDFFLDQLQDVLTGVVEERRTGGNVSTLVVGRDVTMLGVLSGGTPHRLRTSELYDALVGLRAFLVSAVP